MTFFGSSRSFVSGDESTPLETAREVTGLFLSWRHGDEDALGPLFTMLYVELRAIAHRQLPRSPGSDELRTTALVHEAFLRLVDGRQFGINDRGHFLALCARVMRNILVDKAREHGRQKRGGELQQVELDDALAADAPNAIDVLAVDAALERLARLDVRQAEVAQMRVFGGMMVEEIAQALDVSTPTIKRDWRKARMFLVRELGLVAGA